MKTVFKISGVALILIVGYFVKVENKKTNEVLLFNIEALAYGESGTECLWVGSVDCPRSSNKVYMVL